ncbi:MAG TPA: ABC transporter ATP-binding protein [Gaiellaceae bacterium]|nr:ABC transporter ATP-binding protein [Gaiellaceae bacterium]
MVGNGGYVSESSGAAIAARELTRRFGEKLALDSVRFDVRPGELHALLGPNGAGKTTLIRILLGLLEPSSGGVEMLGLDLRRHRAELRQAIGFVPSGDRSFYLRISGLENLVFFARLHGLSRREGLGRAHELLEHVGLADAAREQVGIYSHGMQKRLSVARALLADPRVLLVDEATHDLDPEGAERVRRLVRNACAGGASVVWATQRLEEIRGLADRVTLLHGGRVRFAGGVHELTAVARPNEHVIRMNGRPTGDAAEAAAAVLNGRGTLAPAEGGGADHFVLCLGERAVLGDALAALAAAGFKVLSCRERRSEIEEAFLALTRED